MSAGFEQERAQFFEGDVLAKMRARAVIRQDPLDEILFLLQEQPIRAGRVGPSQQQTQWRLDLRRYLGHG